MTYLPTSLPAQVGAPSAVTTTGLTVVLDGPHGAELVADVPEELVLETLTTVAG